MIANSCRNKLQKCANSQEEREINVLKTDYGFTVNSNLNDILKETASYIDLTKDRLISAEVVSEYRKKNN